MLTLALDTTTRAGSVAVVRDTTVLAVVHGDASRTHGERLPAEIERAIREAGVTPGDLELLAVASGPGAFTGLRIGLAAIQGMAMVLDLPVIAVSALDALALAAGEDLRSELRPLLPVATWMDAARGEVFAAFYEIDAATAATSTPTPTSVPIVATPQVVLDAMPQGPDAVFIGDGATKYRAQILQYSGARHHVIEFSAALAPFLARIGVHRAARGEAGPPHALQPLYVRRPDAELERQRREVR